MQFNCYRVYFNGRLIVVVPTENAAESYIAMRLAIHLYHLRTDYTYDGAYIPTIGF